MSMLFSTVSHVHLLKSDYTFKGVRERERMTDPELELENKIKNIFLIIWCSLMTVTRKGGFKNSYREVP